MAEVWLLEILKGTGKLFLHPVFYMVFLLAALLGVSRVKRERKNFSVRAENAYYELRQLLPLGLLLGASISIVAIALGLIIPMEMIAITAVITIVFGMLTRVSWLSPAYTFGAAFFVVMILVMQGIQFPEIFSSLSSDAQLIFPAAAVLLGLFICAEGLLISINGKKGTSPKLMQSKRGQRVGVHEVKRLWLLPVFLFLPGEAVNMPFEWWPFFQIGSESYTLMLVPFAAGFSQRIQGSAPVEAAKRYGRQVLGLGVFVLLVSAIGYWYPLAAIAAAAAAMLGRIMLSLRNRIRENNAPFFFSRHNDAVMILGVIPQSPASKMGLQVGELIKKVNGIKVRDESSFYEALQKNRAHCKLEVFDVNGEVRFVQRALYEGDHHELGILFVQDERKWGSEAV